MTKLRYLAMREKEFMWEDKKERYRYFISNEGTVMMKPIVDRDYQIEGIHPDNFNCTNFLKTITG